MRGASLFGGVCAGALLFVLSAGCGPRKPAEAVSGVDTTVRVGSEKLDLAPFLAGYPYTPVLPLWDEDRLLLDHQGAIRTLRSVDADFAGAPPDPAKATALTDVDWDSRNRWALRVHEASGHLYWQGDATNDEKIDLWRMSVDGGVPERLTDEPYIYGFSFSPDDTQIALVPRRGEGPFTSCLERMDIASGERTSVLCDTPEATFTWGRPSWSPDARGALVSVNLDGQRSRANLAWVDFDAPSLRLMLDPAPARRTADALSAWLDADHAVVALDDDAEERIVSLDVTTGETRTLWTPSAPLSHVSLLEPAEGVQRLVIVEHTPTKDTVTLVDPSSGEALDSVDIEASVGWLGDDEDTRALLVLSSAASPLDTRVLTVGADSLEARPWLTLPEPVAQSLVACDVERVTFPTFDTDPETGEPRELHAFLYTPKDGPPRSEQPVRITAFYGGGNSFRADTQIHCAAGISTLSPAVRGVPGFGPAFAAMNDGDLGGDEIVDLFYAARWLVDQGYDAGRVGVHGGSHGGYATMRALTFPPGTNDHGEDVLFPLAFGTSRAGFSDIVTFHDTCNIPDWVLLEAGDPATDAERLHDRSPLAHVDRLQAPILLVHGENDSRVPVAESRQFAAACETAGKDCVYVEFPGMGHHIKGLENQTRQYQATLDLIRRASGLQD